MIKRLLRPLVQALRRMSGSTKYVRVLDAPAGPVTLSPGARADARCTFGGMNYIHNNVYLANTEVGRYTYIQSGSIFGSTTIGSFTLIAGQAVAGLGSHPTDAFVSMHPAFYDTANPGCPVTFVRETKFHHAKRTVIGHDVWIGFRCLLMDGVRIGDGAVIAAGAVVTKDVEPYAIVGGVPAKVIRYRFAPDIIAALLRIKWWERDIAWIEAHAEEFADVEAFARRYDPGDAAEG